MRRRLIILEEEKDELYYTYHSNLCDGNLESEYSIASYSKSALKKSEGIAELYTWMKTMQNEVILTASNMIGGAVDVKTYVECIHLVYSFLFQKLKKI